MTTGIASAVRRLHLGKQIAFFICLFAGPNYDLNCDSVCSPLCSIHLIKKSSELQQEGKLLKPILLSWLIRALWSLLSPRDKIPSIVFMHEQQLITGWAPGTTVLRNTWTEEHCLSLESSLKRSLPSQNRAKYLTLQLTSKIFFTEGYIFLWLNAINLYSDWIASVFPIFLISLQNVPGPITTTNCKLNRLTAIVINTLSLLKLFVNGMTPSPMLLR